jgi:hypothetical protein
LPSRCCPSSSFITFLSGGGFGGDTTQQAIGQHEMKNWSSFTNLQALLRRLSEDLCEEVNALPNF